MTPREWIDNLDDTDRKGMAAWGIVVGIAVLGSLVPAIGWVFCLLIGLFWFLFIWGIVLYGWLGGMIPERRFHVKPSKARAAQDDAAQALRVGTQIERARIGLPNPTVSEVREQQQARPIPVPDLHKVTAARRRETPR